MRFRDLLLPGLACLPWSSAMADSPQFLNSNDIENALPTPDLPPESYRPQAPATQLPQPRQQQLPIDSRLLLNNVLIEGGSVYPFEEVAALFSPMIGREVSLRELLAAVDSISQRYKADGYALSYAFLPAQDLTQGQVRVVLVEGYVQNHEMRGDIGNAKGYIDKLAAKLLQERPLTSRSFQRYTTLMAQIPGVSVRASVPPPTTTDGAVTLVTEATRKPFTASVAMDYDSKDELQAVVSVASNSQTSLGEQVIVSALVPPGEDRERYVRLDYSQFVSDEGTRLQAFVSRYQSDPKDLLEIGGATTESQRENQRMSLGVSHPFIASPTQILTGAARLYSVDDERQFTRLSPLPVRKRALEIDSKVRALALEGEWKTADATRLRILSGGLYRGIDALGAKSEVRVLGQSGGSFHDLDFTRLRLSGVQSDTFAENWQGVISGAFFWSGDSLPESEQAIFGDRNFGRGYPSDQAYGDKGWGLAYELNRSFRRDGQWLRLIQPYAAVDAARAWFNRGGSSSELSSVALGIRLGDRRFYSLSLEVARPLGERALDSDGRDSRFGMSFSYKL